MLCVFFFNQKTAYEMRISDWSSDVCSSDLLEPYRAALVSAFGGPFLVEGKRTYRSFSWLINPSYKLTAAILAYASVSYGEKSGAANLSALPGRPLLIDPDKSTAYEIGIKTSFADRRGTFHVDLYWTDIKDYQEGQIDPDRLALGTYLGTAGSRPDESRV